MYIPSFPTYLSVYIYIDQKWIYIKLYSASSRFEHCSNHSLNFFCKCFFFKWQPFWMSKNQFLPFQINTIILIFENIWMSKTHYRWHFWPFQINTKLFFLMFYKMAAGAHFGCPKFTFDRISGHFRSKRNLNLFGNFWQNCCRRPFWMSEIHFRSHFWSFFRLIQNFFFLNFFTKWPPAANLDVRKSRLIDRPFWMSEIHFR